MLNQNQIRNFETATLASLKLVTGRQDEIIFCKELSTYYRYETNGSAFTPDDQYTITTVAGGSTRWRGISGYYSRVALAEAPIRPDVSYLPQFTGFGTPTNIVGRWSRMGDKLKVYVKFRPGDVTAVEARIGFPSGLTSLASLPATQYAGHIITTSITLAGSLYVLCQPGTSYFTFGFQAETSDNFTTLVGSEAFSSTSSYEFFAEVPIAEWSDFSVGSSNVPEATAKIFAEVSSVLNVQVGATTQVVWEAGNVTADTHNCITPANGRFTSKSHDVYTITGEWKGLFGRLALFKNGSFVKILSACSIQEFNNVFARSILLDVGDYIDIRGTTEFSVYELNFEVRN